VAAGRRRRLAIQLAQRSLAEFADDHCAQFAASISYHVLFSLFPLAILLTAVFGIVVRTTGVQADVIDAIAGALPLSDSGTDEIRQLLRGATSDLSTLGLIGIVGVLYSASGMMAAIRAALNNAFDAGQPRPFLKGKLIDVGLVGGAAVAATASLASTIAVQVIGHQPHADAQVGTGGWSSWVLGIAVPLVLSFAIVLGLYRFVPATRVRARHAVPVASGVACTFVLSENLFALYVRHFADYNAIYGSLGAIVAFMFFVYLTSMVFLLGAEVTSEWPRAALAVERGSTEPAAPFREQVRQFLRGLWVEERKREQEREDP
jgi:membrane protein